MDHNTGKSLKLDADDMSEMQDMVAEELDMERGQRKSETGLDHLERRKELYTLKPDKNSKDNVLYAISRYIMAIDSTVRFCINAIIDYAYSGFGCRGGKHGVFFYDDESSAIKKVMVRIAETAKVAKQTVADWLVMAANAIGHFNDWELRRAEKEVKDVADGLYDGRIEKYENGKGMRI